MPLLDVCNRAATGGNCGEEIGHVPADGGCHMPFQILLIFVFGILFKLVLHVAMDGFATAQWLEIVAHDARFQRPLIAVESRAPWVLRVDRMPVRAMFPDDGQAIEVKCCGLSVGDVRLTLFVHKYATG